YMGGQQLDTFVRSVGVNRVTQVLEPVENSSFRRQLGAEGIRELHAGPRALLTVNPPPHPMLILDEHGDFAPMGVHQEVALSGVLFGFEGAEGSSRVAPGELWRSARAGIERVLRCERSEERRVGKGGS